MRLSTTTAISGLFLAATLSSCTKNAPQESAPSETPQSVDQIWRSEAGKWNITFVEEPKGPRSFSASKLSDDGKFRLVVSCNAPRTKIEIFDLSGWFEKNDPSVYTFTYTPKNTETPGYMNIAIPTHGFISINNKTDETAGQYFAFSTITSSRKEHPTAAPNEDFDKEDLQKARNMMFDLLNKQDIYIVIDRLDTSYKSVESQIVHFNADGLKAAFDQYKPECC